MRIWCRCDFRLWLLFRPSSLLLWGVFLLLTIVQAVCPWQSHSFFTASHSRVDWRVLYIQKPIWTWYGYLSWPPCLLLSKCFLWLNWASDSNCQHKRHPQHKILHCCCANTADEPSQLVSAGLFPTTIDQSETAFTFTPLDDFEVYSLASKKSAYVHFIVWQRHINGAFPHLSHVSHHYSADYCFC
jgi:hypothetical protein